MWLSLEKEQARIWERAIQNIKCYYVGPEENYTQWAVPTVKVYSQHSLILSLQFM